MTQLNPSASVRARPAMAALSAAMLLASLGTSIVNIALPDLVEAFGAPLGQVQAVVVAYLGALTAAVMVAGRLGDRLGLKPMLATGLAIFTVASLLCALAPTLGFLVMARGLQGIGAGFLMTLAMAMMRQSASEARLGQAMGLLGTVSALGTALGPSLGGLVIAASGWRGIFWVQVPLAAIALALVLTRVPRETAKGPRSRDGVLSVLDRALVAALIVNILVAAVMMATLVVGPFYLAHALGLAPAAIGLVLAVGPAISMVSGLPSGWLVDSWGSRRVVALGLSMLAAGGCLLAYLPDEIGVIGYLLAIIVLTPGYQLFQAANNTAVLADVPTARRGTVSGLLSLSRNVGLIMGASATPTIFAHGVGTDDFTQATASAFATGMQLTFLPSAGLMVLAMLVMIGGTRKPLDAKG